ncbi:MAG: AmmeMemoRadiSam system protein B [Candidatus Moranbacteria bacterium]|nr:AmmeMemoRadiSam system protein B [Candidatus Moranbacteria bacterium]
MSGRTVAFLIFFIALSTLVILAGGSYMPSRKNMPVVTGPVTVFEGHENKTNLRSYFDEREAYETAFSSVANDGTTEVVAGIVPHHFLAKDLIARFYAGIADDSVERVIVIGPDHFNRLRNPRRDAVTTGRSWDTSFGTVHAELETVAVLGDTYGIPEDDDVFMNEHSVYTEVPFIRKVFPNAKIVPIVVNDIYEYDAFIGIGKTLRDISPGKTVLIVSSDFSHEATVEEAKKSDEASISILSDLRKEELNGIRCDCRSCMAVMLGFLGDDARYPFRFFENMNSADFGGTGKTVTSYVGAYFLAR